MKFLMKKDNKILKIDIEYTEYKEWYSWYPVKVVHDDNKMYHYVWFEYVKKRLCILTTLFNNDNVLIEKFGQYRSINWVNPMKEKDAE